MNYLVDIGYTTLAQIRRPIWRNKDSSYWLTAKYLGLFHEWAIEWEKYLKNLNLAGCRLSTNEDSLIWSENLQTGIITGKSTYQEIVQASSPIVHKWWYKHIWNWNIPSNFKCFLWLTLQNCLKTWYNLVKRSWQGPNYCILYKQDSKSIKYLFISCDYTK